MPKETEVDFFGVRVTVPRSRSFENELREIGERLQQRVAVEKRMLELSQSDRDTLDVDVRRARLRVATAAAKQALALRQKTS